MVRTTLGEEYHIIIIPILQRRKLGHREVKYFAESHTAGRYALESLDSNEPSQARVLDST